MAVLEPAFSSVVPCLQSRLFDGVFFDRDTPFCSRNFESMTERSQLAFQTARGNAFQPFITIGSKFSRGQMVKSLETNQVPQEGIQDKRFN